MIDYLQKWCCLVIFLNDMEESSTDPNKTKNYGEQVHHTKQITEGLSCTKHIYYNSHITNSDVWEGKAKKFIVEGNNAAMQRQNAFETAFNNGFRKVILVENVLLSLEKKHLEEAFNCLKIIEFCVGPGKDGGYYLLGMNYFEPAIFKNLQWDSPVLIKEIIREIGKVKQALYKLPVLR